MVEPALFEWDVFEIAAPIRSPAKCEVSSVIRFLNAKGERPAEIHKKIVAVYGKVMTRQNVTKWCLEFSEGSSTTIMRCKKKSWRGSKGRRQTSMIRGYRSLFQDLINVWTVPATMLKNKVMYRQFIHSVAFVNQERCTCLRHLYHNFPDTPRSSSSDYSLWRWWIQEWRWWRQEWLSFLVSGGFSDVEPTTFVCCSKDWDWSECKSSFVSPATGKYLHLHL